MSEYLAGSPSDDGAAPAADGVGGPRHRAGLRDDAYRYREGEQVRFGIPFNGVVPLWHEGTAITWHRSEDAELSEVLGLGLVETIAGTQTTPPGWAERVEVGTLHDRGRTLRLKAINPSGRRAINDPGDGAPVALGGALTVEEAMAGAFDVGSFAIHIARVMLRAARDHTILLFTLRAPRDPEPHHLLSVPAEVDAKRVMRFHLGTLLEMEGGAWDGARQDNGMALLDLTVPYEDLLAGEGPEAEQGLDADRLVEMAQPVVQVLLKPGFPFALGCSVLLPTS